METTLRRQGRGFISISHLLATLDYTVTHSHCRDAAESAFGIGMVPNDSDIGTGEDVGMADRRFACLVRKDAQVCKAKGGSSEVL